MEQLQGGFARIEAVKTQVKVVSLVADFFQNGTGHVVENGRRQIGRHVGIGDCRQALHAAHIHLRNALRHKQAAVGRQAQKSRVGKGEKLFLGIPCAIELHQSLKL